jgi:hypothetical protein
VDAPYEGNNFIVIIIIIICLTLELFCFDTYVDIYLDANYGLNIFFLFYPKRREIKWVEGQVNKCVSDIIMIKCVHLFQQCAVWVLVLLSKYPCR